MEFVYVVPRTSLFPEFYPHGVVQFGTEIPLDGFETVVEQEGFFVERAYAERTPSLKQVIPYSIVECDGKILLLRRLSTGGEARLHDKLSIGVGGHINPEDLHHVSHAGDPRVGVSHAGSPRAGGSHAETHPRRDPISAGSDRELAEELKVNGEYNIRRVGILNDDSNAVGAVHVGVIQVVTVQGTVEIREKDQLEGRLVAPAELSKLLARGANFETWSKLLIERLAEFLPQPAVAAS